MANTKLRNPEIVTDRPSCESLKQQSLEPTGRLSLNSTKDYLIPFNGVNTT